jgi:hypothetical protein
LAICGGEQRPVILKIGWKLKKGGLLLFLGGPPMEEKRKNKQRTEAGNLKKKRF